MFVFPPSREKTKRESSPAGKIDVGPTITILYSLTIIHGQARFIGVDASKLPPEVLSQIKMSNQSTQSDQHFGFMVRDSNQPTLDIHIAPSFMAEIGHNVAKLQKKMAREGNLNVTIAPAQTGVKIIRVWLD